MADKIATVKVRMVVEVTPSGSWGDDCTMGQIQKQGTQAALDALSNALFTDNERRPSKRFRIVSIDACDMVVALGGESK